MMPPLRRMVAAERRRQRGRLLMAGAGAATASAAGVLLLGLSGWFIAASALAGAGGAAAVLTFNYLLPSAAIRLLAILRTGGRYVERTSGHDAALHALARIRPAVFRAIAAAPAARAMTIAAGDAVACVVEDVGEVEARFVRRPSAWGAVSAACAGAALLLPAGPLALAAVATVFAAMLAVAWSLAARLDRRGRDVPPANARLKEEFAATVAATAELRAYGLEEWAALRIGGCGEQLAAAQERVTAAGGQFDLLQALAVGFAAMAALGAASASPLPMAALAALGALMTLDGATPLIRGLQRRGHLRASEERLDAVLRWAPAPLPEHLTAQAPTLEFLAIPAALEPGVMVGLTGPSGCGKTTLLEQLLRLRDVPRGCIKLGGVEINDLDPRSVRACFAFAPQDAALLAGTMRDNLLLAGPAITEPAMWDALRDAALADRVRMLPEGLDTWIGDNGALLSGGERRRLALARALLRDAPWLLLDEPTEGLESVTELHVVQALTARLARRRQGAIIISHRTAPIAACCRVVRLPENCRLGSGKADGPLVRDEAGMPIPPLQTIEAAARLP